MSSVTQENCPDRGAADRRPSFCTGERVAVRCGTADPDFPDMRLDGWTGTIVDVDRQTFPILYLVQWSQGALGSLPPDYRDRCESEDMLFDRMWLLGDDLEVPDERRTHVRRRAGRKHRSLRAAGDHRQRSRR